MRIVLLAVVCLLLLASCEVIQAKQLEDRVTKALQGDPRTSQIKLQVTSQGGGTVKITGEVWQADSIDIITEIAKGVAGVKDVINACTVEEPGSNLMQDETVPSPLL